MAIELRAAIPVHHTDTSDGAWDGPATEAAVPNTKGAATFRAMYAWEDPNGDPDTKAAYKFIHHFWTGGAPGAASTVACSTGIGVLNGGRGGTTVSAGDMRGVWSHLAAHLRDAQMEPPPMRSLRTEGLEHRAASAMWEDQDFEIRASEEGNGLTFDGYAAVFGVDSLPIIDWRGTFIERILPGAFKRSISTPGIDVRMYLNHNADLLLGSSKAGTVQLQEDARGLRVHGDLPDTQLGRDTATLLRRGDIRSMSFTFDARHKGADVWDYSGGIARRTLKDIKLAEVSPVTGWPAYEQTTASVRHLADMIDLDEARLGDSLYAWLAEDTAINDEQYHVLLEALNRRRGSRGVTLPSSVLTARAQAAPFLLMSAERRTLDDLAGYLLADVDALRNAINKLANGEPLLQQEAELLEAAIEHLEPPDEEDSGNMMGD